MRPLNPPPAPRSMQHLSSVRNKLLRIGAGRERKELRAALRAFFRRCFIRGPETLMELSAAPSGRILQIDRADPYVRNKFMLHRISWRVVLPAALTATFFSFPAPARPQDQQTPSVAEAARRAREQKKKPEKPARIINDDNLKPAPGPTSPPDLQTAKAAEPRVATEGAAAAPPEAATPAAPATPPAEATPEEKKDSAAKSAEAESMKAQVEALEKELDGLKRELPLERDNYYSKADYEHDTAGKARLDALLQQLTDKQQDVDALKTRLAALLEQLAREQPASAEAPEKPATPPQP